MQAPMQGFHPGAPGGTMNLRNKQVMLGGQNGSNITAGARTVAITLTQNVGSPTIFYGFALRYVTGLETVLVSMLDTQHNRELITGNVQICTVGALNTLVPPQPFVKIHPFELASGQSVQLTVTNQTGGTINANEIALTLYGFQQ